MSKVVLHTDLNPEQAIHRLLISTTQRSEWSTLFDFSFLSPAVSVTREWRMKQILSKIDGSSFRLVNRVGRHGPLSRIFSGEFIPNAEGSGTTINGHFTCNFVTAIPYIIFIGAMIFLKAHLSYSLSAAGILLFCWAVGKSDEQLIRTFLIDLLDAKVIQL